jgi:hypothetical protein
MADVAGFGGVRCPECDILLGSERLVELHLKNDCQPTRCPCTKCGTVIVGKMALARPLENDCPAPCPHCGEGTVSLGGRKLPHSMNDALSLPGKCKKWKNGDFPGVCARPLRGEEHD